MQGYEAINRLLIEGGVETVFHYMAEDTMKLIADLETERGPDLRSVHARHEQGAMAMADGYARAGDRIGVCVVGRGPGIAQTGTALLNARKNGTRLLVVTPTPAHADAHDPKEFEQDTYLHATAGDVVTIRSETTLVTEFRSALRRVRRGDGPLAVQIPKDVLDGGSIDATAVRSSERAETERAGETLQEPSLRPEQLEPDANAIEAAVEAFLDSDASRPPVVLVGEGAALADAREPIEELAERLSAVIVTSLKGRHYFGDHPFAAGFVGNWGSPLANELAADASYVLAVGCSLNTHTVDEGRLVDADASVVHVDTDPNSIGRFTPVDVGIVGDAARAVEALSEAFEREGIDRDGELWSDDLRERIADSSPLDGREYPAKEDAMDPRDVVEKLEEVLPDERLVASDGGQFRKWMLHGITAPPADSVVSCDFAAIGLGLPTGVGVGRYLQDKNRTGQDERTAVTFCGDGGFMMSIQEVETAVRHEIPLVVIVGNDSSLGAEYHFLDVQGGPGDVARLSTPCIADVAESLGATGIRIRRLEDIDDVADRVRRPDGPVVLECVIDHEVRHHSY